MVSLVELELPKAWIAHIIKDKLPQGAQIQKDAKIAFSRAATVFISYLASASNDHCRKSNLKTLSIQHVYKALEDLQLESFIPILQSKFQLYQQQQALKKEKKSMGNENGASNEMDQSMENDIEGDNDLSLENDQSFENDIQNEEEIPNSNEELDDVEQDHSPIQMKRKAETPLPPTSSQPSPTTKIMKIDQDSN